MWSGVTWFLPCIFLIELGAYPCMKYCERTQDAYSEKYHVTRFIFVIALLLIFGFIYGSFVHKALPWSADIAVEMAGFFCLGIACRRYGIFNSWSRWQICIPAFGALVVSSLLNYFLFGGVNPYLTHYGELILYFISAISGIVMSVGVVQILRKCFPHSFIIQLLNYCGKNSIIFYLVNVSTYAYIPTLMSFIGLNVYDEKNSTITLSSVGNGLGYLCDDVRLLIAGGFLTLVIDFCVCAILSEYINKVCPSLLGKNRK